MSDSESLSAKTENEIIEEDHKDFHELKPLNHSFPYVNYREYFLRNEDEELLTEKSFEVFGNFNNENIFHSIKSVIYDIENTELTDLIKNPPENVKKFLTLYRNYVSDINFEPLAFYWPPPFNYESIFPMHTKKLHFLLMRMIQMTSFPQKMLTFFMTCLVDNGIQTRFKTNEEKIQEREIKQNKKKHTKKENQNQFFQENKNIYAMSVLATEPDVVYAILNKDKYLHIMKTNGKNSELTTVFKERISRVKYVQDENTLEFYNQIAQKLIYFHLNNDDICIKWSNVYDKENPPHFLSFLTDIIDPIPDMISTGVYNSFLDLNMLVTHTLCSPSVVKPNYYYELSDCLITIANYQNRLIYYLNSIFASVFESNMATIDYLCSDECILTYVSSVIASQTEQKYQNLIISKLCNYIENEDSIIDPFQNKDRLTVVFFTVMKYILDSFNYISNNFKHFCAMLSSYITIKFNSTEAIIRIISSCFASFICKRLDNRKESLDKTKANKNYKEIAKLIKLAFSFQKLVPKYQLDGWEERFYNHLYPKVAKFSLSLCDLQGQITLPSIKEPISDTINQLIEIIVLNNKHISSKINELAEKQKSKEYNDKTTATSWCFAINLSMHFHKIDEKQEHDAIALMEYLYSNSNYTETTAKDEFIANSEYDKELNLQNQSNYSDVDDIDENSQSQTGEDDTETPLNEVGGDDEYMNYIDF